MGSRVLTPEQVRIYRLCYINGIMDFKYILQETKMHRDNVREFLTNKSYFDQHYSSFSKNINLSKSIPINFNINSELVTQLKTVLKKYDISLKLIEDSSFSSNKVNKDKLIFLKDNDDNVVSFFYHKWVNGKYKFYLINKPRCKFLFITDGLYEYFAGLEFDKDDCVGAKLIANTNSYYITEDGVCFNGNSGKLMATCLEEHYLSVSIIYSGNIRKRKTIHRLVAEAWVDNPFNKPQVNHIDGVKTNNHYSNLEWVTPYENHLHAVKTGLLVLRHGENANFAKISNDLSIEIRRLFNKEGYSVNQLSKLFNVHPNTIRKVVKCITFKNTSTREDLAKVKILSKKDCVGENAGASKLTLKEVNEIRELYLTGNFTQTELSKMFNVTQAAIGYLLLYKSWKTFTTEKEVRDYLIKVKEISNLKSKSTQF